MSRSECMHCCLQKMSPEVQNIVRTMSNPNVVQQSQLWDIERQKLYITASMISSVVAYNPFKSRQAALSEKISPEPVKFSNECTLHGQKFEKEALELYSATYGHKCIPNPQLCKRSNFYEGRVGCSPDGITYCGILLEIKCPLRRKISEKSKIPIYYIPQLQFSLHLLKLDSAHFYEYDAFKKVGFLKVMPKNLLWIDEHDDKISDFIDDIKLYVDHDHLLLSNDADKI